MSKFFNYDKWFAAAEDHNAERVIEMTKQGIDVNIQDRHGWTALMLLAFTDGHNNLGNSIDAAKVLLDYGADVNIQSHCGNNALILLVVHNHTINNTAGLNFMKFLLNNGARVDFSTSRDWTVVKYCLTREYRCVLKKWRSYLPEFKIFK